MKVILLPVLHNASIVEGMTQIHPVVNEDGECIGIQLKDYKDHVLDIPLYDSNIKWSVSKEQRIYGVPHVGRLNAFRQEYGIEKLEQALTILDDYAENKEAFYGTMQKLASAVDVGVYYSEEFKKAFTMLGMELVNVHTDEPWPNYLSKRNGE